MIYWFETDDRVLNRRECLTRGDAFLRVTFERVFICIRNTAGYLRGIIIGSGQPTPCVRNKKKKKNKNPFEGKRGEEFNPSFPRFVSNDFNNETGSEPFGYIPREESAINNYGMFGVRCV